MPRPSPKQQVHQYCKTDPENIEQEDHAEPLHARILQDILKWWHYCCFFVWVLHELQWNCYTVEFIYTIVPQTYIICERIFMQINYLPAGGAVGAGESEVSTVTLYTQQSPAHKRCFIRHHIQDEIKMISKSEIQWYKNTSAGFDFETCRAQPSVLPPANHSNPRRRDYLCDVTNTRKQLCSPFVVVLDKRFFFKQNISVWSGLWDS